MGIAFILKRDIAAHWNISRNCQEGIRLKCLRLFWVCIYLVKALWCGLRSLRHEQLGSEVEYQGKRLQISNWAQSSFPTLAGDGFYQKDVPREEIRNIVNARELWHRFKFGFSFYTSNWHQIDVHRRLYR